MLRNFLFLALFSFTAYAQQYSIEAPAQNLPAVKNPNGTSIISNGRLLTPAGKIIETAPHPFGLVLSPDHKTVITANSGIVPFSISVIKDLDSPTPSITQIPKGAKNDVGVLEACFMGLAVSPDNKVVYVAGGDANKIFKYNLQTGEPEGKINCSVKEDNIDFTHGYLGDMCMTKDGKTLYVVDQIGFRIIEIDLVSEKIIRNIPSGRYPFGITLSPDESKIIVANVGQFEYKRFTDLDPENLKETAHAYPSSKYLSREMVEGDEANGVPALGDANSPEGFSVWLIDKLTGETLSKIKTGFLVGEKIEDFPAIGGSSPNSVVATDQYIFVSNGSNDCVSVIDIQTQSVIKNIGLNPEPILGNLRGLIPFGLAPSPDKNRLYVAESGINAVGVIDINSLTVLGHIPTAWFPSKLAVTDNKIYIANAKGLGSGPNGGKDFELKEEGSYIGALMKGNVQVTDVPTDEELKQLTKRVISNNYLIKELSTQKTSNPIPSKPLVASEEIKYIVFISKENRTYDEVFGQLKNGNGDPDLARWGLQVPVANRKQTTKLSKVDVMPNHTALAHRFAIGDNFFCDSDVSADGHKWIASTYPNEWCETATAASYGGKKSQRENSAAPGNLAIYGSAGSIYPEDYNEAGSLWDHLERNGKDFFNFGFGVEMAGAFSDSTMKYVGEKYTVNYPLPAPLFDRSSKTFPTYNMAIPDQFRADEFMREFNERWGNGGLPSLITLQLPNDHGSKERPAAGFPFQASYMADNDLAVGRVMEFLSRTPYWKNMAIFITEDDPQGGIDHVDAHRSIMMVVSPWAKKDYVSHQHYSFGSIFKTFWHIMGLPYLNQYDATATDMHDMFTSKPDFSPFNALPSDIQIFDPQKALTPIDEKFDWKAFSESEELDRVETMQKRRKDDDDLLRKEKSRKKNK